MDLDYLLSNYHILLEQMQKDGYGEAYLKVLEWEIKWISRHPELSECKDYVEVYKRRLESKRKIKNWKQRIYHKKSLFTVLKNFDENNEFPNHHIKKDLLIKRSSYDQLNEYYKSIIAKFRLSAEKKEYAEITTRKCISKTSNFLLFVQERGHSTLETVRETDVISFFTDADGNLTKSYTYKKGIETVLKSDLEEFDQEGKRVCNLLPALRKKRKNIQYLSNEEAESVRRTLEESNETLSKRDTAIGMLLYYTGMRAGDIASLEMNEIDWEKERIVHKQGKTGNPVEIPMNVKVGNALYDYIVSERPDSCDSHVFLWMKKPYEPIDGSVIWPTANRVFKAAGIRQNENDRKGSHIFRHHLATYLAGKGISQPVISSILGHTEPSSLNHYLYADIEHLRECALSIELFPIKEGVLEV